MIQRTIEEQNRALFWSRRRAVGSVRVHELVAEADQLLHWLEECLVLELRIAPGWVLPRLRRLLSRTDPDLSVQLGSERRPAQLMDFVYTAQEILLRERVRTRGRSTIVDLFPR